MVGNSLTDVFSMHRSVPWTPSTAGDDASDRSSAHTAQRVTLRSCVFRRRGGLASAELWAG